MVCAPQHQKEESMRADVLAMVVFLALPTAGQRGVVNGVSVNPAAGGAAAPVAITVTGSNPCGAVRINYGDGHVVTHAIDGVPATINYRYSQPGTYQIRVEGMGNCDGEAATRIRLSLPGDTQPGVQRDQNPRFRGMDQNGDGVITRAEWRGSEQSFRVHDWNRDGVLSGDEVRAGARRPDMADEDFDPAEPHVLRDWTEQRFANLDHNGDGRITREEWHYDIEQFRRVDRNRDGAVTKAEFLGTAIDDDREDRFQYLDVNGNGRIERAEWHGSRDAFEWMDRNNDGVLSRAEVVGDEARESDRFANLDVNRDRVISLNEWHWSRRSFEQRDVNGDGVLSRREFVASEPGAVATSGRAIVVDARQRWTDTGISVRAGDLVTFSAAGTVQLSPDTTDLADPRGSRTGRRAPDAPLRQDSAGGLIARIGDSAPIYIGDRSGPVRMPRDGQLYLGVNDDYLGDNVGEFRVTISVVR
jgi:Ca2+-binding EF-hand superfamily protein